MALGLAGSAEGQDSSTLSTSFGEVLGSRQ
jgi:hypothetical protein